jgi:hypothetical protein
VLPHIVQICAELGIGVIAEGIETDEQLERLKKMGVRWVQGFHIDIPRTAADFAKRWAVDSVAPPKPASKSRQAKKTKEEAKDSGVKTKPKPAKTRTKKSAKSATNNADKSTTDGNAKPNNRSSKDTSNA